MKNILVFCFVFLGVTRLYSQNVIVDSSNNNNKIYTSAEQPPKFQGDDNEWFAKNIVYNGKTNGTIYLDVILEKDGSISSAKILRGVSGPDSDEMDKEALRVIKIMPKWKSAYNNGKPVRFEAAIGVKFKSNQSKQLIDTNRIFTIVQEQPKFPGDINDYLSNNIIYPSDAKRYDIQGTVYCSFVIEKDGTVSNVKVIRGVSNGRMLEHEAVRVISDMPKWKPGKQNGRNVRVQYMVPIHFIPKNNTIDNLHNKN